MDLRRFGTLSHCFLLRASITQCVINGFLLFLQIWNPLIKRYNIGYFNTYHIADSMCVLEKFNCMRFDGWTLNGTRTVIPRSFWDRPHLPFTSHHDNSMRHQRNFFIFAALNSSYQELHFNCFHFLSYCRIGVCARELQLHAIWWLDPDSWHWTLK